MNIDQKIVARFDELIQMGQTIEEAAARSGGYGDIDREMAHQWLISSLNLVRRVFEESSDAYLRLNEKSQSISALFPFREARGVLKAAKDDYEHGHIFELRQLIEAEVFDDFLEQAEHLIGAGYIGPAAVIAGCVLEDGLRKKCQREGISLPPKPTIEPLNVALAKHGTYSVLVQKQITALSDVRIKAAHGKWTEFSNTDVEHMISQVRHIMATHIT